MLRRCDQRVENGRRDGLEIVRKVPKGLSPSRSSNQRELSLEEYYWTTKNLHHVWLRRPSLLMSGVLFRIAHTYMVLLLPPPQYLSVIDGGKVYILKIWIELFYKLVEQFRKRTKRKRFTSPDQQEFINENSW